MSNYLIRAARLKCPLLPLAFTEKPNYVDSMRQRGMINTEETGEIDKGFADV